LLLWRKAFEKHLKAVLGTNLEIIWTENRRSMITFDRRKNVPVLRLHSAFEVADETVRGDLVYYLTHPRAKIPKSIHAFVKNIPSEHKTNNPRLKTTSRGRNYNLRTIYKKLNKKYFEDKLDGHITWGRRIFGKKRSIVFGSFSPSEKLIRIHPVLDTELVPLFYLESVIHHEMVHEYLDSTDISGDDSMHSSVFRELEEKFSHHELAKAWQKRHVTKLLRYSPGKAEDQ